ncbi:Lipid A core - O-antigen ligase [Sedimentisphaera cyanobacteriorum]|uniref:Lipid A core-O-antigen ligase n=1 Tax=Sedimentisphaera cyanobacteriorum TaxID=1940790 RepID=A0A1Q2HS31_9BACT|nr:O-antigen ligase family protein [Sedimentisphaera cyanobacteriorum]AQQ10141.1 Lipid A core - O-antigen ligase [Sedimentisphaera cyanobacteriorum]
MAVKKKKKTSELMLLICCGFFLAMAAVRLTTVEALGLNRIDPLTDISVNFSFLLITVLCLSAFCIYLFSRLGSNASGWIKNGSEIPALIFAVIAALLCFFASEKRAAVNHSLMLISGLCLFHLITQLKDRNLAGKLLLAVLFGACAVNFAEGLFQLSQSNEYMIKAYEENPQAQLEALSIAPGSLDEFMYEHRLYSNEIKGFFTNSNAMGSLALLCFFPSLALFLSSVREKSETKSRLLLGVQTACILSMVVFASSKGCFLALFAGLVLFGGAMLFKISGRKKILAFWIIALGGFGAVLAAAAYAALNQTLPGGGSMHVRGQYWFGGVRMLADNIWGVGADNFRFFYPHFKPPEAMETVTDPHNFILSLACQFGILGLGAFLAAYFLPIWKSFKIDGDNQPLQAESYKPAAITAGAGALAMLILRPLLIPVQYSENAGANSYAAAFMFIFPAVVFFGWAFFLSKHGVKKLNFSYLKTGLICGIAAFLIHNTIDFAIFETGNFLAFSAACGLQVVISRQKHSEPVKSRLSKGVLFSAGAAILAGAIFFAALPAWKMNSAFSRALQTRFQNDAAINRFANSDPLSSWPASLAGKAYLRNFRETQNEKMLEKADRMFTKQAMLNRASFKPYLRLAEVSELQAKNSISKGKKDNLEDAFSYYQMAIMRYPGKGEIHLNYALALKKLGKNQQALREFKAARKIELMFREEFRKNYPDRELVSRIGREKFKMIEENISRLSSGLEKKETDK